MESVLKLVREGLCPSRRKQAFKTEVHRPLGTVAGALAASLGRVSGVGMAPIFQEGTADYMRTADPEVYKKLRKEWGGDDPDTKDTLLSVDGLDYLGQVERHFSNPKTTAVSKILGIPTTFIGSPTATALRQPHFNPFTDTAVNFGNHKEIAMHELGHAKDFGSKGRVGGDVYRAAYQLEQALGGEVGLKAGPLTQWTETQANRNAMGKLGDPASRRRYRRRLWPARSTYITALASTGALLHPGVRERLERSDVPLWALPVATTAAAAVGGRAAAEAANLFDRDK